MVDFHKPIKLPKLMVAPNGSRMSTTDHASVPVTISKLVETAKDCFDSGAEAMHFHIRDKEQRHILDSQLYTDALIELNRAVPNMHFQIATEAVGGYSPEDIRNLTYDLMPPGISIALLDLIPDRQPKYEDFELYRTLYHSDVRIQHICFTPDDLEILARILESVDTFDSTVWCMFAIGHYSGRVSKPELIPPFIKSLKKYDIDADWSICAFDKEERHCLKKALSMGGCVRVGFENSIWLKNGKKAKDNGEKVREVVKLICDFNS